MCSSITPHIDFANLSSEELRGRYERNTARIRSLQADSARFLAEIDRRHQDGKQSSPFETTPAC